MSHSQAIAAHLPFLRRYARALTGSQKLGDAYVRATLEAMVADPALVPDDLSSRAPLYGLFQTIWSSIEMPGASDEMDDSLVGRSARERLDALMPERRQALLLTALEGFSADEAGEILDRSADDVVELVNAAMTDIARDIGTDVLIVEDESVIALDLANIVKEQGHRVLDIAITRAEAVEVARKKQPGLILADIQLADDSSGIDAVKDILSNGHVPVIFITAYPERLLTGEKPEPVFLITKPFLPDSVKVAISQALFFHAPRRGGARNPMHHAAIL